VGDLVDCGGKIIAGGAFLPDAARLKPRLHAHPAAFAPLCSRAIWRSAYNPCRRCPPRIPSRRVKRERGAASSNGCLFRDCPRNGKPFEGRSFMPLPHVAAGRRAVRTASPETGLRPGGIAASGGNASGDRSAGGAAHGLPTLAGGRAHSCVSPPPARCPCAALHFRVVPVVHCRAGMHGATRSFVSCSLPRFPAPPGAFVVRHCDPFVRLPSSLPRPQAPRPTPSLLHQQHLQRLSRWS